MNLPQGATTATVESKTNFFRPVAGGYVEAVTRLIHRGRTLVVVADSDSGVLRTVAVLDAGSAAVQTFTAQTTVI